MGAFNVSNLLAAAGTLSLLGMDWGNVVAEMEMMQPVPGRMMRFGGEPGQPVVVVDYAHTPDALENVLKTIRQTKPEDAALWCLFGCGGDRDATKRPLMGAIAERLADHVIVTADNTRTEAQAQINEAIRAGMTHPDEARWIHDRRVAIEAAARLAASGDVVLVAGKGHEDYQIIGTEKRPFDDREEVRQYFGSRGLTSP